MAADLEQFVFPVTKLERQYEDDDVFVPKRGAGSLVATSALSFSPSGRRKATVAPLTAERGSSKRAVANAERVRDHILAGLDLLSTMYAGGKDSVKAVLDDLPAGRLRLPIQFLSGHELLADVVSPAEPTARFDVDVAGEIRASQDEAMGTLYALALLSAFSYAASGQERTAILAALSAYEDLDAERQGGLQELLKQPAIDAGGIFARFLRDAAGASEHEKVRLSAWARARAQIELPYSADRVRRAMREETDLASLRQRIYDEINDTYRPDVDSAACERISQWASENDIRLVGGRFSRAFYLDAMLMASSSVLPGRALLSSIGGFEKAFDAAALNLKTEGLSLSFDAVGGEAQKISNLASKDRVSVAEIEGILRRFTQSVRDLEAKAQNALDRAELDNRDTIAAERAQGRGAGKTLAGLTRDRKQIRSKVEGLMAAVSDLQTALVDSPKREPSFMVFFQRLFPLDALNMGIVNELEDPFFGEDDEVHELIRECGHRMYVTPNLHAWLRHVDDWIEAHTEQYLQF